MPMVLASSQASSSVSTPSPQPGGAAASGLQGEPGSEGAHMMSGMTSGSRLSEPPVLAEPPVVAGPLGRVTAGGWQAANSAKNPRQTGAVRISHTRIPQNYRTRFHVQ